MFGIDLYSSSHTIDLIGDGLFVGGSILVGVATAIGVRDAFRMDAPKKKRP